MAILKSINAKTALKTHSGLYNCIQYVLDRDKVDPRYLYVVGTYDGFVIDKDLVYKSFLEIKKRFDADNGRQYAHTVISFHKDESVSPQDAYTIGMTFAEKAYEGHQTLVALHLDKDHLHCHLVTNTVSYLDGSKLHKSKKDLETDKEYCNELCRAYHLSVPEKGKHFDGSEMAAGDIVSWDKDTYRLLTDETKKSYVADCGMAYMNAMKEAYTLDDFKASMLSAGWSMEGSEKRKHITFVNAQGKRVRASSLRKHFNLPDTKELIISELNRAGRLSEPAEEERFSAAETAGRREQADEGKDRQPHRKVQGRRR